MERAHAPERPRARTAGERSGKRSGKNADANAGENASKSAGESAGNDAIRAAGAIADARNNQSRDDFGRSGDGAVATNSGTQAMRRRMCPAQGRAE